MKKENQYYGEKKQINKKNMEKTSNYLVLNKNKGKQQLIKGFKIQINELKRAKIISEIGNLIENINKKELVMGLFSLDKFKQEALVFSYEELNKVINKIAKDIYENNVIFFKLELNMPKLYEIKIEQLIVWIYKVEIKEEKLKKDNKKQFFYLIYKFQKAIEIKEKQTILLELLYKIQLYIKNAR